LTFGDSVFLKKAQKKKRWMGTRAELVSAGGTELASADFISGSTLGTERHVAGSAVRRFCLLSTRKQTELTAGSPTSSQPQF